MPNFFDKKAEELKNAAKGALDELGKAAGQAAEVVAETAGDLVNELKRDKEIIVYPTYGYRKDVDGGAWVIPVRVWVSKARRLPVPDEFVGAFIPDMGPLSADEVGRLRSRIAHFIADDDTKETVSVSFDGDPDGHTFRLPGETDPNGLIQHDLELPEEAARSILKAQGAAAGGWLSFKAASGDFEGAGRARLVEPVGLSVISDIDDTIKVTEIPAGKRIVLRNTFLRDYVPAAGMAGLYSGFGGAEVMFHYVSGSPWQLYKLLGRFVSGHYPEGAFHMKDLRKNLLTRESWEDFRNFSAGDEATREQKGTQISRVMLNLPRREFILVGDSGEKDPEIYRDIKKTFGARVRQIFIRDVVGERDKPRPNRLDGMTPIPADTIVHGVTQFRD